MDLFDELRKAGPVDKKDFKKNEKDEKKKSSHDRDSEHKHKKHSEHKHSSSSPDHKKNSSHHEHKKSSSSSSHGKIDDNQHKKKHSSSSSSSSHGSSSKHEESPSKKSSSHGISSNSKNNETPSRKNSLQDNEKHKSSGHSKKEDSSSSSSSKHHKSEGDSPKKKSKHDKERESSNKSSSNHVETSGKIKLLDTSSKDLEAVSKTKFNHDKELNSSSKDKKKSSLVDDVESPIKKKSSSEKYAENSSSKKLLNHDKDVAGKTTTTKSTSPEKTLDQKVAKFNAQHKTNKVNNETSNQRRESLPSPVPQPHMGIKKKADKSRSLSPPKSAIPMNIKPLKIKVERKRLEEFNTPKKANDNEELALKKTPTKAQQKLFEPPAIVALKKTHKQILKEFKVKPCVVRIHRDNLKKLMREFSVNKLQPKLPKLILGAKRSAASSPTTVKSDGSPPMKKGKMSSPPKAKSGSFFIKLAAPKPDKIKLDKKSKHSFSKHNSKSSWQSSLSGSMSSSSAVAQHNKIKNSKSLATITPTKFSRTQLISTFGNHWFKSHVRIKRCKHPLMRIFESNARARHQQSKQNKSKNLSVSFRDQVEVFGGSTDSDDSYDENFSAIPTTSSRNGRRGSASNSAPAPIIPSTPIVMPARLKKVENGRVVDDIVLDPSLFLDPKALVASTPYSPGRKKRDHKSFSPLKDEGTPSPRKEQLKLANERIPPAGLRRLNIEEEDDEDDDCEYIGM